MKPNTCTRVILTGLLLSFVALSSFEPALWAQAPWGNLSTPQAQRNVMRDVQGQVNLLRNATRTACNFASGGFESVYQQFETLRGLYSAFTQTLNSQQASRGANQIAELAGGLNILAEAFTNYQDDVANGRDLRAALSDMCHVLNEAAAVWLQEFNKDCLQLRVGW
ncbi:MAG: hypothetical protein C5B50_27710 [Verrucomicrobia bacterium]|nr:MAG: hypothetical protein C5B50_27710 [Verrucomicrobiota bacterium]